MGLPHYTRPEDLTPYCTDCSVPMHHTHTARELTRESTGPVQTRPGDRTTLYCTDCQVTPVNRSGIMCDKCTEDFFQFLKWESYYEREEQEIEITYQAVYHTMRF